jgi:hypothetical protein
MTGRRRVDRESVTSLGWHVRTTRWDHVIEIGRRQVGYLDGRPLVAWRDVPATSSHRLGRLTDA